MKSMCDYINRTPQTVENLVRHIEEDSEAFVRKMLERMPSAIYLVGSGTSLNAAYLAQHAMEKVLSIPCFVYPAMTFTDTVHTVVENSCDWNLPGRTFLFHNAGIGSCPCSGLYERGSIQ